jgi:hypothetical protein
VGFLALTEVIIGVWALLAPASFYRSFPGAGQAWVSLLPPYNEHLIADVGELSLALAVVLGAAAITGQWLLSVVAIIAFAVYTVPHMIFHSFHLEGFSSIGVLPHRFRNRVADDGWASRAGDGFARTDQ